MKRKNSIPKFNKRTNCHLVQVCLDRPEAERLEALRHARGDRSWSETLRKLVVEAKA